MKYPDSFIKLGWIVVKLVAVVKGVQEGQEGMNEWHLTHVGTPQQMVPYQTQGHSLIFLRTEQNYIAALNSSNGAIVWRRGPKEPERVKEIQLVQNKLWVRSEVDSQTYLRFYDPTQGALVWEHKLKAPSFITLSTFSSCLRRPSPQLFRRDVTVTWRNPNEYLTVSKQRLLTLAKLGTSKPLWQWEPPITEERVLLTYHHLNKLFVVGVHIETLQVFIYSLDGTSGEILGITKLKDYRNDGLMFQMVGGEIPYLVWPQVTCNKDGSGILDGMMGLTLDSDPASATPTKFTISGDKGEEVVSFREAVLKSFSDQTIHFQYTNQDQVHRILSFKLDTLKIKLTGQSSISEPILAQTDELHQLAYVTGTEASSSTSSLKLIYPQSTQEEQTYQIDTDINPFQYGPVRKVLLGFQGQEAILMLTTYDGSIHLVKGTKGTKQLVASWHREESLALVTEVAMVELPDSHLWTQESGEGDRVSDNLLSRYLHRLTSNLYSLSHLSFGSSETPIHSQVETIPVRDRLGLRKFIILATSTGKLLALDSLQDGKVVWSRCIACNSEASLVKVIPLRESEFKLPPVVGVVIREGVKNTLMRLDGFTGLDLDSALPPSQSWESDQPHLQISKLSILDPEEGTHILAILDQQRRVTLVPSSPAIVTSFCDSVQPIHSFLNQESSLSGVRIECDESQQVMARPVWSRALLEGPALGLTTSVPLQVPSVGRVMADRRVLYKYLNPHLAAFATFDDGKLTFQLLDMVTGYVLHEAVHSTTAPTSFQAVIADHVVLYQFFDAGNSKGYQVVVLELFEDSQPDVRPSGNGTFSSFFSPLPYVASRAYVMEYGATALGVTQTRHGITDREFLFALNPTNRIVGISRQFLDALRPHHPSPSDPDHVMPYQPVLPFLPPTVLSYHLDVAGIHTLVTTPTLYESTTITLAYGHDLFLIRHYPVRPFDVLQPDFSKSLLVLTVLLLLGGLAITNPMLARKRLHEQWT